VPRVVELYWMLPAEQGELLTLMSGISYIIPNDHMLPYGLLEKYYVEKYFHSTTLLTAELCLCVLCPYYIVTWLCDNRQDLD
jgi:hypothetical protein